MVLAINSKHGRLTVKSLRMEAKTTRNRQVADCVCDCGSAVTVRADRVGTRANSCGCLSRELSGSRIAGHNTTHGKRHSKAYNVWASVVQRCNDPQHKSYGNYGGRGIILSQEWRSFERFYADMGDPPEGMSLERRDNEKGYSKENCVWATRVDQANNKRSNRLLTHEGKTQTVSAWSRDTGIRPGTIRQRIDVYGWSVAQALTKGA